jgi:hypothetical protein
MAGCLENLTQHFLCDPRVETSDIQRTLVRLGGGATHKSARAVGGHGGAVLAHGRRAGGRDGVGVLRDDDRRERRGGEVRRITAIVTVLVPRRPRGGLRGRRQLRAG